MGPLSLPTPKNVPIQQVTRPRLPHVRMLEQLEASLLRKQRGELHRND